MGTRRVKIALRALGFHPIVVDEAESDRGLNIGALGIYGSCAHWRDDDARAHGGGGDAATRRLAARVHAPLQSFTGFKLDNLPGKPTTRAPNQSQPRDGPESTAYLESHCSPPQPCAVLGQLMAT